MLLNSYVNMNNSIAKIKHFKSAWDKKIFGLNMTDKVFKSLVDSKYFLSEIALPFSKIEYSILQG